jgi:hypothetical protein
VNPTTPPDTAVVPPAEAGRWQTPDGKLSLVLPAGCTVDGAGPFDIVGLADITVMLFPADAYRTDLDRDRLLEEFATIQQAVSVRGFTRRPITLDGATGVQVGYVNDAKRTTHAWYLGKANRLWRVDIDIPGIESPVPPEITAMLAGLRLL